MIPAQKQLDILQRLLEKTRRNEVNWQQKRGYISTQDGPIYILRLTNSAVELRLESPETEPDRIYVRFLNRNDSGIGLEMAEEGDPNWELLRELYNEADRVATGWDEVLQEIESAVGSRGVIGVPAGESGSDRTS